MTAPDGSSSAPVHDPRVITRASKSNLALAFIALPPERREAITVFYAFCRVIDDIADDPTIPPAVKQRQLDEWKRAVEAPHDGESPLAAAVRDLLTRYPIQPEQLREIIRGCEMDLTPDPARPVRYATFEDLRLYCYRVASMVGLVSIEIFGYRNELSRRYAVELGYALQLTNIIRDVAKDLRDGNRIYLPREDLDRFGISEDDLLHRKGGPRFTEMMTFQADRAEEYYTRAVSLLPPEDRPTMTAAEIMRQVYHRLLEEIRADDFRVFDRFHRLTRIQKAFIVLKVLLLGR